MYLWGEVMAGKKKELGFRDVGNSLFVGFVYVHSLCKNPSSCSPVISAHVAGLLGLVVTVGYHGWLSLPALSSSFQDQGRKVSSSFSGRKREQDTITGHILTLLLRGRWATSLTSIPVQVIGHLDAHGQQQQLCHWAGEEMF